MSPSRVSRKALVNMAVDNLGGLDILVANCGRSSARNFQSTSLEAWEASFNLTLMSAVRLVRRRCPTEAFGPGRVVFITVNLGPPADPDPRAFQTRCGQP